MLKKQLLRIADMLPTIPLKEWEMGVWCERTKDENGNMCGTVGCAVGTAVMKGIAPKRLSLKQDPASYYNHIYFTLVDKPTGECSLGAVANAYRISGKDAVSLFIAYGNGRSGKDSRASVAKRIRHFVKTGEVKI